MTIDLDKLAELAKTAKELGDEEPEDHTKRIAWRAAWIAYDMAMSPDVALRLIAELRRRQRKIESYFEMLFPSVAALYPHPGNGDFIPCLTTSSSD